MQAIINCYGPAGIVHTVSLRRFLAGFAPAIVGASDVPPDGKAPSRLVYLGPMPGPPYVPLERYAPGVSAPVIVPRAARLGCL